MKPESKTIKKTKNRLLNIVLLFVVYLTFFTVNNFGQSITWQRTYGGPFDWKEGAHSLCEADSGNFYAVGYTFNESRIKKILFVLKLNQYGDTIWTKVIGNNYTLIGNAACSDGDGGCVITGDGDTSFVINLDRNGNIKWWKNYGISGVRAFDIIKTNDGGYAICGEKLSTNWYGYTLKIDSTGNEQWQSIFLSTEFRGYFQIIEWDNSGYYLFGNITDSFIDTLQVLITRISTTGNFTWDKRLTVYGKDASITKSLKFGNNFVLTGTTTDTTGQIGTGYFLKIDSSGNQLIEKRFISSKNEAIWDLKLLNSNKYVFTMTRDSSFFVLASKVMITDSLGNILQQKTFNPIGPAGYIWFESILPLPNGDLLFGGFSELTDNDSTDVFIARTDSLLNVPPIGIISYSENSPLEYKLYPAYPNPFNPVTNIKFQIPLLRGVSEGQLVTPLREGVLTQIRIYDITGREVYTYSDTKQPGTYEIQFDGTNLASGLYFYSLEVGNPGSGRVFKDTKKMVLLK